MENTALSRAPADSDKLASRALREGSKVQRLALLRSQLERRVRLAAPRSEDGEHALLPPEAVLPTGQRAVDAALPDAGLPRGSVVELSGASHGALATSLALGVCRSAQQHGVERGRELSWCAFVDPSGTLYAPGVEQAGVRLERLLVVRPRERQSPLQDQRAQDQAALGRVALRLLEARVFEVVVVDLLGVPGSGLEVPLSPWASLVRRLSVVARETGTLVVLLTSSEARRALPLPVALRVQLSRPTPERLRIEVAKEQQGRVSSPRSVAWAHRGAIEVSGGSLSAERAS